MLATITYVPLYVQGVLRLSPGQAGAAIAPMVIGRRGPMRSEIFPAYVDPAWVTQGMERIDPELGVKYLWNRATTDTPWPGQGRPDLA